MSSFERLFKLAKKTGDRMIVFDSAIGDGFAAIPIDEYEAMVTDPRGITQLSGDAFLEQINEDIALWRAHQEQQEREEFADTLEEKMMDEPPFDPFGEDSHSEPAWHSAGDLLQDRYKMPSFDWMGEDDDDFEDEDEDEDDDDAWDFFDSTAMPHEKPLVSPLDIPEEDEDMFFGEEIGADDVEEDEDDMLLEPLPFDPPMPQPIPEAGDALAGEWQEEPLDEDPIFFEEPIA
ncbi:MAG: hypothetical protein CO030_03655 [Candidatus Magasanikbacteria bacterium CG_4_9_14_0_2_um_filter_42_11]|uniref:Uncharacterized protein n=1 Tax=Candidatus Magasanikbacteria bacterium CG_4_9_14_0_2_um_filter_42_11 TaxID=1974643 RepID=A0A2M8F9E1_9BACT|nr:MAG: hypothetical protein COU34_02915 [Candidatus Magasanikbacteria bacterium CG10_big_fil_rev_8_21_14_0_10_43_9]PIY92569.1 MAG: hypothetical protein COY70_02540 [Candidatus Magasanikbacteria bacterium CG_4_10_14_0_8_um_filter_42_12]PJC52289.1 MAG: hypothetical protein CO030_03655 [Candidatus Magasanikbacteria bacterium CG_4_9_14_0_2_um_filter_42_11]